HEAGILHECRRTVDVRLRDHRVDERHVVDATGKVWQQPAYPSAALSVLSPFPGARHAGARRALEELNFASRIQLLPVPLDKRRLVIECIALAGRARHEELDDPFGTCGEMDSRRWTMDGRRWLCARFVC